MNKKTKYYFLLRVIFTLIIVIVSASIILNLIPLYSYLLPILFDTLRIILTTINTLAIIILIILIGYYIYIIYKYLVSVFYRKTSINFFEAIYSGFLDIYLVYDSLAKFADIDDLRVDMNKSMITFKYNKKHYCVKFLELFGSISNKSDNEMWAALSKPKKEFARKVFQEKIKFPNPLKEIDLYIEEQADVHNKEVTGFVVLNGFYKLKETNDRIYAPYEVSSIVRQ